MQKFLVSFWAWYERHYAFHVTVAFCLFILQLAHLAWMTGHVVALRLFGEAFFSPQGIWEYIIILIDYTEIPALLSVSLIYIHALQKRFAWKYVMYLVFLNSQWLHLFWITDEFVLDTFFNQAKSTILPVWLAWVAISIDYLELPVMYDTFRRMIKSLRTGQRLELE